MKFKIVDELNVPAKHFWNHLFTTEMEAVIREGGNLEEYHAEVTEEPTILHRRVRTVPRLDMPGALKKVVGSDTLGYIEEQKVPKDGTMEYQWESIPDKLADKSYTGGNFKVEPLGEDRCRRTIEGEVKVKIFGVGTLAEKYIVGEMEKTYHAVATAQEKYVKEKEC